MYKEIMWAVTSWRGARADEYQLWREWGISILITVFVVGMVIGKCICCWYRNRKMLVDIFVIVFTRDITRFLLWMWLQINVILFYECNLIIINMVAVTIFIHYDCNFIIIVIFINVITNVYCWLIWLTGSAAYGSLLGQIDWLLRSVIENAINFAKFCTSQSVS